MIKEIQGLKKFTDCGMPSNEKERIHKAETAAYNQAINDVLEVLKNRSIPVVVGRSEHFYRSSAENNKTKCETQCLGRAGLEEKTKTP